MTTHVVVRGNTETINWGAAILAGIVGMLAFTALQMAFAWSLKGQSPWTPLHMVGATILGPATLAPAGAIGVKLAAVTGTLLLVIAVFSGVVLAVVTRRLGMGGAVVVGALFSLAAYYVDVYGLTRVFPWLADWRDWTGVVAYVVQGALTGGIYKAATHAAHESAARAAAVELPQHDLRRMRSVPLT
ncbi:MAG TPA: hypothetical protein VGJ29_14895 [Vicinamibacterales bacterium]